MRKKPFLFNKIAIFYSVFFNWQVRNYHRILNNTKAEWDFSTYKNVIDIGCGTGALCKVLQEYGFDVTGLDPAEAMIEIATKKNSKAESGESSVSFICGDVLEGLAFENNSFDLAISSYVAHGLMPKDRLSLYSEMKRVAKRAVVLIDYNEKRSLISDIVEWIEGGDYFNFIKTNKVELLNYFGNVKVINTGKKSSMYICKID